MVGYRDSLPSVKPSIKRWDSWEQIRESHKLGKQIAEKDEKFIFLDIVTPMLVDGKPDPELFVKDGLHLSEKSCKIWTGIVDEELNKQSFKKKEQP